MTYFTDSDPLWKAAEALLESLNRDNEQHGGLLSLQTIALGDKLRVQLFLDRRREELEYLRPASLPSPGLPARPDSRA